MPSYMWFHPALGALTIALIFTAFALNAGRHKAGTLHSVVGGLAGLSGLAAFAVAWWAVGRWGLQLPWPGNLHFLLAALTLGLLLAQVALGLAVHFVLGGPPRFLRFHRRLARVLVVVAAVTLLLGLATASRLMYF